RMTRATRSRPRFSASMLEPSRGKQGERIMKLVWSGDADLVAEMQPIWLEPVGRSPVDWHVHAWQETKAFDSPVVELTDTGEYRPVTAGVWVSIRAGETTCTYGRNPTGWWCVEYTWL